jgi:predicted nucleic acid-binding protein
MLLDTCILIDVLRGRKQAAAFIDALDEPPALSAVTLTELFAGVRGRDEEAAIRNLADVSNVLPVDRAVAELAGHYLKSFMRSHGVDPLDAIIAATAHEHGLKLVTLNIKHFPMFPGLERPYSI